LLLLAALIIGVFVYLEWLGSEEPQTTVERPVAVPVAIEKTE
jgi:hypothetical protein